jgi:hypothetical protein
MFPFCVAIHFSDLEFILNLVTRESYGEDVGESDTDQDYDASEDSYESDFIDDGDVEVPEDNDVSESMDDGDVCSTPDRHKQGMLFNCVAVKYLAYLSHRYTCFPYSRTRTVRYSFNET